MLHRQKFAINFVTTPFLGGFFFLMLYRDMFAINFVTTPFLGGFFFSYVTQAKLCHKFWDNPILGRKSFFLCYTGKSWSYILWQPHFREEVFFPLLHRQKFAINFVTTPLLRGSFFSYVTQDNVCHKLCDNSIFGRKFVFLMQHRQKFAINFLTTPFLVENLLILCYTGKSLP